ncbi:MAG: tetratricopeptide repeat protein, partial [Gemmataceae bacterium]
IARFPDHDQADSVRRHLEKAVPDHQAQLEQIGLDGEDGFADGLLHEQVQIAMNDGRYAESRKLAADLLAHRPRFVAAWNNTAECFLLEGNYPAALDATERAIAVEPENAFARSNRLRCFLYLGRTADAAAEVEVVAAVTPVDRPSAWVKLAEGLAFAGRDAAVLGVYGRAKKTKETGSGIDKAMLELHAGVAEYRLGREKEAKKHWTAAVKAYPALSAAEEQLAELKKPAGERAAGWVLRLTQVVPRAWIDDLSRRMTRAKNRPEGEVAEAARQFLAAHPPLLAVLPILLDRGCPAGRKFALMLAQVAKTPEALAALKEFALSDRGPDSSRHEAARAVKEAKLFPPGPVRMFMAGEWQEIRLTGFEITDEPSHTHSPAVVRLAERGHEALMKNDHRTAKAIYTEALALEPDAPDLHYNLSMAYRVAGENAEADRRVREVAARFPHYSFGVVGAAMIDLKNGDLQPARDAVGRLMEAEKMHTSEFMALAGLGVELAIEQNEADRGMHWVEMAEQIAPDHPNTAALRKRAELGQLLGSIGKVKDMAGRRRKKRPGGDGA